MLESFEDELTDKYFILCPVYTRHFYIVGYEQTQQLARSGVVVHRIVAANLSYDEAVALVRLMEAADQEESDVTRV